MATFHPIIQKWFTQRYGEPTDIQSMSWPRIAEGRNLLITAPTGSGKTLTAFLWTLNRFATGDLQTGKNARTVHQVAKSIKQRHPETA
ncbi:MAG: DEAD/DEAH box helicase [Candidatus Azotimanducaceae bacterium WSBS_2022_MAG_OTU7]